MKKVCIECGKILTGKQEKFCSDKCHNKYWCSINYKKRKELHKKDPMICPNCGGRKKYNIFTQCSECLEVYKKNKRKRLSMGMCTCCGKYPIYKWNRCEKCYKKDIQRRRTPENKAYHRKYDAGYRYVKRFSPDISSAKDLNTHKYILDWIKKHNGDR